MCALSDGAEASLTAGEFDLVALLATEAERVFTKPELLRVLWGVADRSKVRALDSRAAPAASCTKAGAETRPLPSMIPRSPDSRHISRRGPRVRSALGLCFFAFGLFLPIPREVASVFVALPLPIGKPLGRAFEANVAAPGKAQDHRAQHHVTDVIL